MQTHNRHVHSSLHLVSRSVHPKQPLKWLSLVPTAKASECDYALCLDCDFTADISQPYWSVAKSIGLHRSGDGANHRIEMFKLEEVSKV